MSLVYSGWMCSTSVLRQSERPEHRLLNMSVVFNFTGANNDHLAGFPLRHVRTETAVFWVKVGSQSGKRPGHGSCMLRHGCLCASSGQMRSLAQESCQIQPFSSIARKYSHSNELDFAANCARVHVRGPSVKTSLTARDISSFARQLDW